MRELSSARRARPDVVPELRVDPPLGSLDQRQGRQARDAALGGRSGPQHEDGHRLIGLSEFDLPTHKGHTVLVKGLFIKAAPVSRVNVTSVAMVSTACAPAAK